MKLRWHVHQKHYEISANSKIDRPVEDHGSGWSKLWDSGESDLWDRGKASPALVDIIERKMELLDPFTPDGERKKALVPVREIFSSP